MNPVLEDIQILLGGGDWLSRATEQDMDSKCISFEDVLPIIWALQNYSDPGTYGEFVEALKVNNL